MKKGISIWSFPTGMSIEDSIKLAAKAGFDGIELALNEDGPMGLNSTAEEVESYVKVAKDAGVEITSLATGLYWSYSLTSGNADIREKAKNIVLKQLDFAAILGVDTILVVPGAVGVDFIPGCEIVDYDVAYERAAAAIKELVPYAEAKKVGIGLENVWNKFLLSPLEMKGFVDGIGSPFVGAFLDVGNVVYSGYPEQWVKILGKRIRRVHFKDYRCDVGSTAGFVDLLSGDVNFPAVMNALKTIGYTGYIIAEMVPPAPFYKYYPEQLIFNTSSSLEKILER